MKRCRAKILKWSSKTINIQTTHTYQRNHRINWYYMVHNISIRWLASSMPYTKGSSRWRKYQIMKKTSFCLRYCSIPVSKLKKASSFNRIWICYLESMPIYSALSINCLITCWRAYPTHRYACSPTIPSKITTWTPKRSTSSS